MGSTKKKNTLKESAELEDIENIENSEDEGVEEYFEHFKFVVDKGQSLIRLDKYLTNHMNDTSRSRVQMAIEAGYVRVQGEIAKSNYKVKPLDEIIFVFPYERRNRDILPENIPLDIIYEDDDVILINKPAGMVVHPGHGHFSGTLLNALAYHLNKNNPLIGNSKIANNEGDIKQGILVHRIDKDTSGILVVAKNDEAQLKLAKQFFEHTTKRKYIAIVWGNVAENEGTIDANIARDESDRMKFAVPKDSSKGKHAVTHYKVIERFGYLTVVECSLETGRTHQIRVHMKHIGHPLFNDERYGGNKILNGTIFSKYKQFMENCFSLLPRQGLHAKTLGFTHPTTNQEVFFDSPLPEDMQNLIVKMRNYTSGGSR